MKKVISFLSTCMLIMQILLFPVLLAGFYLTSTECHLALGKGTSMLPAIDHNYTIQQPVDYSTKLSVGDIVAFSAQDESGVPILVGHRIITVCDDGQSYVLKGDNNDWIDTPINRSTGEATDKIPKSSIVSKTIVILPHILDPIFSSKDLDQIVAYVIIAFYALTFVRIVLYIVRRKCEKPTEPTDDPELTLEEE